MKAIYSYSLIILVSSAAVTSYSMEGGHAQKPRYRIDWEKLQAESEEREKRWKEDCLTRQSQAIQVPEEFKKHFRELKEIRSSFKEQPAEIDLVDINKPGNDGKTLLMQYLYNGEASIKFIEYLISRDAKANLTDSKNYSAIYHAIKAGNFHTVPVLRKYGAQIPMPKKSTDECPLMMAAIHRLNNELHVFSMMCRVLTEVMNKKVADCCDCLQMLIDNGHEPDQEYNGETALIKAVKTGLVPIVELLLQKNANPGFIYKGKTALEWTQVGYDQKESCADFMISDKPKCAQAIKARLAVLQQKK